MKIDINEKSYMDFVIIFAPKLTSFNYIFHQLLEVISNVRQKFFCETVFLSVLCTVAFYQSKCRHFRNVLLTIHVNIKILYENIDMKAVLGLIPLRAIWRECFIKY